MGSRIDRILKNLSGVDVIRQAPAKNYSFMRTGGTISAVLLPQDEQGLASAVSLMRENGCDFRVIGKGSNILFSDSEIKTVIICTAKLDSIKIDGSVVTAESGVGISRLCLECARAGLSGLEFACGIPGSVGGAVAMNAGAFGGSISDTVSRVYTDRHKSGIDRKQCGFGYRQSMFQESGDIVTSVEFEFALKDKQEIKQKICQITKQRKHRQPSGITLGSTFKNTNEYSAGKLIEQANLKGFGVNGAFVAEKHANFIINSGGASSNDIKRLIEIIKKRVFDQTGITLIEEIQYIGDF